VVAADCLCGRREDTRIDKPLGVSHGCHYVLEKVVSNARPAGDFARDEKTVVSHFSSLPIFIRGDSRDSGKLELASEG